MGGHRRLFGDPSGGLWGPGVRIIRAMRIQMPRSVMALAPLLLASCGAIGGTSAPSTTSPTTSATTSTTKAASGAASSSVSSAAAALQSAYVQVVAKVRPSVVQITDNGGLGSGVVYDARGDIVTNAHVVGTSKSFSVQFVNGKTASATLVGTFAPDDLAVIRVHGVAASQLHPASIGNSDRLQVGDIVLAVGNPLALSSSVTEGIVSAVHRTVVEPQSPLSPGGVIADAIQTSAAINPGNSGGALVDLSGSVIGIPTLAAQDPQLGGAAVGIGFAIPSSTVVDIANQIIRYGHVINSHRADLGVYVSQVYDYTGQPAGVAIDQLTGSASPAGKAGLAPGDVIVSLGGKAVHTLAGLKTDLAEDSPGQRISVGFLRPNGSRSTTTVTLGTLPGT